MHVLLFGAGINWEQSLATGVIGGGAGLAIASVSLLIRGAKPLKTDEKTAKRPKKLYALLAIFGGLLLVVAGVSWRLTIQGAGRGSDEGTILGKWKHSNGLNTLEFTADGNYTITDESGEVGKAGKYRVIDRNTMEWEHTTRFRRGMVVVPGQRDQPTSMTQMIPVRIEISEDKLVISSDSGSSRWHR
jgi:hypothetical protein